MLFVFSFAFRRPIITVVLMQILNFALGRVILAILINVLCWLWRSHVKLLAKNIGSVLVDRRPLSWSQIVLILLLVFELGILRVVWPVIETRRRIVVFIALFVDQKVIHCIW